MTLWMKIPQKANTVPKKNWKITTKTKWYNLKYCLSSKKMTAFLATTSAKLAWWTNLGNYINSSRICPWIHAWVVWNNHCRRGDSGLSCQLGFRIRLIGIHLWSNQLICHRSQSHQNLNKRIMTTFEKTISATTKSRGGCTRLQIQSSSILLQQEYLMHQLTKTLVPRINSRNLC